MAIVLTSVVLGAVLVLTITVVIFSLNRGAQRSRADPAQLCRVDMITVDKSAHKLQWPEPLIASVADEAVDLDPLPQWTADAVSAAPERLDLSSLGHEFRTPLNAILGFSEILLLDAISQKLTPNQQQGLEHIRRAGLRLLGLIETDIDQPIRAHDAAEMAKLESSAPDNSGPGKSASDKGALARETVDPVLVARRFGDTFRNEAEAAGVILLEPSGPAGMEVVADRISLRQILFSMTAHAVSTCRPGGEVSTEIRRTRDFVEISIHVHQSRIPGRMPGEDAAFSAGHPPPIRREASGLAQACRLALNLNGRIEARADEPQTLILFLPPAQTVCSLRSAGRLRPKAVSPQSLAGLSPAHLKTGGAHQDRASLLYIEDNPSNILLMRRVIEALGGFELHVGETGPQGLAMARDINPDVILTDINLPGFSGLEVKARLDADPDIMDIPVIALSANASPEDLQRGRDAGFLDYLTKPLDITVLAGALNRAMGQKLARLDRPRASRSRAA